MTTPVVLWDMDGVHVDSMASAARAWAAWGRRRGIDGVAVQGASHGRPAREVIALTVDPATWRPTPRSSRGPRSTTRRA